MTRKIISLNDDRWEFGSVPQKPFGDFNDLADVGEWLPARAPGDVRLDLLRAGKIPDPFFADDNEKSHWVDSFDWWYVRRVALDSELELKENTRAFLVFEGIDYQSAVWLNGKQLGRHAGMFSRQVYEITDRRRQTIEILPSAISDLSLAVRIWGSDALPKMKLSHRERLWRRIVAPLIPPPNEPFPDRYSTLKSPMQFGWDFAPRLRTCGIWDDASIVITRSVFIEEVWIRSQVGSSKSQAASINVALSVDSDRERDVRLHLNVREKNTRALSNTHMLALSLKPGKQTYALEFTLPNALLWNPWDRGEPNLYELDIEIRSTDGASLDTQTETFGIRSLELVRNVRSEQIGGRATALPVTPSATGRLPPYSNAEPWTFIVNGAREFLRGANWVPLDSIPGRLTRVDYERRLRQARDANINFLRVWGGGLREKRAFYDLCDELGILVWQEFPFAGAVLDRFPQDRAFLEFVDAECGAIVRALRNHPSLAVWCGGNEFSTWGHRTIITALRDVVGREDGTRAFKPASPYRDESHNWRVWHRGANLRDYRKDATPFLSEFGVQSAPNIETLRKFLPPDSLFPPNRLWEYHRAELKKLFRYTRVVSLRGAERRSNLPSTLRIASQKTLAMTNAFDALKEFVDATQCAQSHALQIAIEHMRRRKGKTAGVAFWQLNDPWRNISWSIIDYDGVPKRAYHTLKQLYAPVLVSFDYALMPRRAGEVLRGDLWIVNDTLDWLNRLDLHAIHNGAEIGAWRESVAPDSSTQLDSLAVTLHTGANQLRLVLRDGKRIVSENEYDLNYCDVGEIGLLARLYTFVGNRLMK